MGNNRVQEVAASTGTQWGTSMTADDIYTVAGSSTAAYGYSGDGGAATSALLFEPIGVAVDSAGDLYIADSANDRIREVRGHERRAVVTEHDRRLHLHHRRQRQWRRHGGRRTGHLGRAARPSSLAFGPSGTFYITDEINNVIREVSAGASPFTMSPVPGAVTVNESTGAKITFYPQVAGSCTSPLVVAGGYCALPEDLTAALTYNSTTHTYSFSSDPAETYTYNSTGQLTAETDAAGDTLTLTYGSPSPGSGNCPSTASSCNTITSAGGRALVIGFNSGGFVTSVTDPLGRSWTYAYNSSNDLTSVTDPMSRVTSYTYGDGTTGNPLLVNDLLTVTKPNAQSGGPDAGDSTVNVYNSAGQVTSQTDPMGFVTTLNYPGSIRRLVPER